LGVFKPAPIKALPCLCIFPPMAEKSKPPALRVVGDPEHYYGNGIRQISPPYKRTYHQNGTKKRQCRYDTALLILFFLSDEAQAYLVSDQSRYKVCWFGTLLSIRWRLTLFSLSFLLRCSLTIIINMTTMTPISDSKKRP
jgi:hypothetical protein